MLKEALALNNFAEFLAEDANIYKKKVNKEKKRKREILEFQNNLFGSPLPLFIVEQPTIGIDSFVCFLPGFHLTIISCLESSVYRNRMVSF